MCVSRSAVLSEPKCVCFCDSQEEDDAGVGHGVRQTQNAAAHDGVAQVEDRHAKGGFTLKLPKTQDWNINFRDTITGISCRLLIVTLE